MILGKNQTPELEKKLSPAAIQWCKFAGSDFKFLKLEQIVDSLYSDSVTDQKPYQLCPGSTLSAIHVNDKQPLLMEQCQTGCESKVSLIVSLRKYSAEKLTQIPNTEPQVSPTCS